jgi:hypothetical protein
MIRGANGTVRADDEAEDADDETAAPETITAEVVSANESAASPVQS